MNRKHWIILGTILFIISSLLLFFNLPIYQVLAIEKENTEVLIAYCHVKESTSFDIRFIHSIHLSPVLESYYIQHNQIIQDRLVYEDYAVGMPSNHEGEENFLIQDGKYILENMNRSFPFLDIRIAQVMPEHDLFIYGQRIPLANLAKPGSWIRLQVKRLSMWQLMRGVDILER